MTLNIKYKRAEQKGKDALSAYREKAAQTTRELKEDERMYNKILNKKAVVEKEIELLVAKKADLDEQIKEKEKIVKLYDELLEGEDDIDNSGCDCDGECNCENKESNCEEDNDAVSVSRISYAPMD